jgi:hypothetical protein
MVRFENDLKETIFVVEATNFERFMLWKEWHDRIEWEQGNTGKLIQIGELDNRPVCASCQVDMLNTYKILFIDMTSQVRDTVMLEEWLDKYCSPRWSKGTRLARTNASNFHNVIHALEEVKKHRMLGANQFEEFVKEYGFERLEELIENDDKARRLASDPEISK